MRLSRGNFNTTRERVSSETLSQQVLLQSGQVKRYATGIYGKNHFLVKAQEKAPDLKVDVDMNKTGDAMGGDWMSNPLIWVIGALVLIVLIALVARGGGNK